MSVFTQKGFTKNFLTLMKERENLCCDPQPLFEINAIEGVSLQDSNTIILGQPVGTPGNPAQLTRSAEIPLDGNFLHFANGRVFINNNSGFNIGTAFEFQVTGQSIFAWEPGVANMHPAGDSEVFGAAVMNKLQRNDGVLIYERKIANVAGTTTAGSGLYHVSVDTAAGMPASINAAGLGTAVSAFTALFQMTTQGVNLNVGIAGPTVSGRAYNNWFAVVNRSNPFFGSPTVPFLVNRIPMYVIPATSVSSVLSQSIAGAYTFGVDCDSKPIQLRALATTNTGTHMLILDANGSVRAITIADLQTLLGI